MNDDELLDRAMRCFWTRGYRATSIADLVEVTGAKRSRLYRTHPDKAALFLASLEHYAKHRLSLVDPMAPIRDQVRQWMQASVVPADDAPRGCLLLATAGDFPALEPEVQAEVQRHLGMIRAWFAAAVRATHPDRDPREGAAVLMGANTAAFVLARTGASTSELEAIIDAAVDKAL